MATRYAPYHQREALEQDIKDRERIVHRQVEQESPGLINSGKDAADRINRLDIHDNQLKQMRKQLAESTPPDIEEVEKKGVKREQLERRLNQLEEALVKGAGHFPRMRTKREYQECPAGTVDLDQLHQKFQKHYNVGPDGTLYKVDKKKGQQSIAEETKDLRRILYKEMEADMRDLGNLETLRPDDGKDDSLINYARRSYASPAKNLTAEEYEERFDVSKLTRGARMIHEMEKQGKVKMPDIIEQFKKLHTRDEEPVDAPEPVYNAPWWAFPDGTKIQGKKTDKLKVMQEYLEKQE